MLTRLFDDASKAGGPPAARVTSWVVVALLAAACLHPLQDREPYIDGVYYLSALHSLYVDGDVDLTNEAEHYQWLNWYSYRMSPAPGGLRNPFPIGPSLLWLPFYAAHDAFDRLAGGDGVSDGGGPIPAPAYFGTTFWVVIGLFLLADVLRQLGASHRARLLVIGLIAFASPLPAYVVYAPDMGHGCSFASVALLLWTCVWCWRTAPSASPRWLLCGLALGVAFSVRWQDALLGLIPVALLLAPREDEAGDEGLPTRIRGLAWLGLGGLIGALPQLGYWKALYGRWVTIPQGGDFLSLAHVEPLDFLFSTWNGVFLSHPLLLLAVLGLLVPNRGWRGAPWSGRGALRWAVILALVLELASCMLVRDWWAGGSFGQRRVVSLLPLFALGLYALLTGLGVWHTTARRRALATVSTLVIAWNVLSLIRLYDGSVPYNPADPNWYATGTVYERYDYGRYFGDLVFSQGGRLEAADTSGP